MCQAVRCRECGKTTWTGCGEHIDAVRAQVPAAQWCPGHQSAPSKRGWFRSRTR